MHAASTAPEPSAPASHGAGATTSASIDLLAPSACIDAAAAGVPDVPGAATLAPQPPCAGGLDSVSIGVAGSSASAAREDSGACVRHIATPQRSASPTPASATDYNLLLNAHTDSRRVARFVRAVLRRLLPAELLGSEHNVEVCAQAVRRMVWLRRFEGLPRSLAVTGLRHTDMPWLTPPAGSGHVTAERSQAAARDAAQLLWWVLADVVVPLLRAQFYATESSVYKNRVFFFRKPVWSRIRSLALDSLRTSLLQPLSEVSSCTSLCDLTIS